MHVGMSVCLCIDVFVCEVCACFLVCGCLLTIEVTLYIFFLRNTGGKFVDVWQSARTVLIWCVSVCVCVCVCVCVYM